jgi:cytochrome P450 family 6
LKIETTERCEVPSGYFVIEKGVLLFIPVQAIHMNPNYYPHPEKFDPDRFGIDEIKKRPPYTFLPFGAGEDNNYIGIKFAEVLIKYGLCILLAKYRFQVDPALEKGNWLKVEKL